MKTKLEMAHEWYMKHSESPSFMDTEVEQAWQYADEMQAEADKREDKSRPTVLQDDCNHKKEIRADQWSPNWRNSLRKRPK